MISRSCVLALPPLVINQTGSDEFFWKKVVYFFMEITAPRNEKEMTNYCDFYYEGVWSLEKYMIFYLPPETLVYAYWHSFTNTGARLTLLTLVYPYWRSVTPSDAGLPLLTPVYPYRRLITPTDAHLPLLTLVYRYRRLFTPTDARLSLLTLVCHFDAHLTLLTLFYPYWPVFVSAVSLPSRTIML